MIHMTNCTYVCMRFCSFKFLFLCDFIYLNNSCLFFILNLERVKGIEPSRPAWKAGVLPLNYTRIIPNVSHSFVAQNFIDLGGGGRIRTFEDRSQRVYSPPHLTALVPLHELRGYRYHQ